MPDYVTVQVEKQEKNAMQETAAKAAVKLGVSSLSLRQLIRIMHEQYKESLTLPSQPPATNDPDHQFGMEL